MAAKKSYLFTVRRVKSGAIILSVAYETSRPALVQAQHLEGGAVRLVDRDKVLGTSTQGFDGDDERFELMRWISGESSPTQVDEVEPRP